MTEGFVSVFDEPYFVANDVQSRLVMAEELPAAVGSLLSSGDFNSIHANYSGTLKNKVFCDWVSVWPGPHLYLKTMIASLRTASTSGPVAIEILHGSSVVGLLSIPQGSKVSTFNWPDPGYNLVIGDRLSFRVSTSPGNGSAKDLAVGILTHGMNGTVV